MPTNSPGTMITAAKSGDIKRAPKDNMLRLAIARMIYPKHRYIGMQYLRTGLIILTNLYRTPAKEIA